MKTYALLSVIALASAGEDIDAKGKIHFGNLLVQAFSLDAVFAIGDANVDIIFLSQ